ncbi:MAG: alpha/beta fold hydrolase [Acidimicrobiales bacterium]|nr:alpha/beta fold hydrolase [Acidimicrobiales bacterium]
MEKLFVSDGIELAGHLARPRVGPGKLTPGLVICHGFPSSVEGGRLSAHSFPELAERIANELGWSVLVFTFRGCGDSAGDFSLRGWLRDVLAAVAYLRGVEGVAGVWVAGFGTGGALAICAAALDSEIRGVAAIAAPADFDDWATHPRRLLQHARDMGIISSESFPPSFEQWARELKEIRAIACVQQMEDRPLLVMHGSEDEAVPVFDARVIADAHGLADLRIIEGGAHQLRHDPRAVATLLGWLDRQPRPLGNGKRRT